MADILTDKIVQKLSKLIDPAIVRPENFSVDLGFTKAEGNAAAIGANLTMYQHGAFDKLLSKYVMKHGRKSESALQLRQIFLESGEMKPCADFVKAELEKFKIPVPSDAETLVDTSVPLPSPPCGIPGEVAEAAGGTKTGAKTKEVCKDPAYKPDEEMET
ncbi:uncharacterized protein LOC105442000 [Strongylocentrotus purpuratus]|uniref:Uncharacterized protein n=1 Tax=Strongylocentrotus purpuratus TaxID=7668 RepID=A0A7M7HK65_STRPU|nr:uncharacterized protein LOC105442000 [Strongylocentrotus purpuratus]|eukprot:XP_011672012.1 PREDICTED: uncharacterized protein LOC105442000 [Strongylocentrotus purpuratus]